LAPPFRNTSRLIYLLFTTEQKGGRNLLVPQFVVGHGVVHVDATQRTNAHEVTPMALNGHTTARSMMDPPVGSLVVRVGHQMNVVVGSSGQIETR